MAENLNLPACLIIMDGFGLAPEGEGNAISIAKTPVLDDLFANRPMTRLEASGLAVGLPEGQMGNSEVGHLNIGAGRIVDQELTRINKACESGTLATNPVLSEAFAALAREEAIVAEASDASSAVDDSYSPALHLMGLLSDGGVHSSNEHLYALIEAALDAGVKDVRVHCFMDGRDVPPTSGAGYVEQLEARIDRIVEKHPDAKVGISSIMGRYYAMDRDNRWDRVSKAYDAIVMGKPSPDGVTPKQVMESSYADDVTDEFVVPVSIDGRGMRDGDKVVFFNFRPDRAREITRAIVDDDIEAFDRGGKVDVEFICLTEYDPTIDAKVAFAKEFPENVLADVLADAGLTQYHIAETEKYAHVTFFLNGGREEMKNGEERKLIASPKVATYDLQPEMSGPEVAKTLHDAIMADEADVYIVNFANCDMVGHTGSIPAAVCAVESVDAGVGQVLEAMKAKCGTTLLTADHGNADQMLSEDGSPHTAHTCAKVPFVLIDESGEGLSLKSDEGCLADIAPTLLQAIGIPQPKEMTGRSLLA